MRSIMNGKNDEDDSTESSEEEEDEEIPPVKFQLPTGESVYSEAFLAPLVEAEVERNFANSKGKRHRSKLFVTMTPLLTLILNGVIQFGVIWKVKKISDSKQEDTTERLFHHLCKKQESLDGLPFTPRLDPIPTGHGYFNCAPITPILAAGLQLDLNGDGLWSLAEAKELHETWKAKYPLKRNTIPAVWYYVRSLAFKNQFAKKFKKPVRKERSQNWTAFPVDWFKDNVQHLSLCAAADKNLCGNLEARGILEYYFPKMNVMHLRLAQCEEVMDRCSKAFGQEYQVYVDWASELCGSTQKNWIEEKSLITTSYSLATAYTDTHDAITKTPYSAFLIMILLIWWMCVFEEVRLVFQWWVVLILFPFTPSPGQSAIEITDEKIAINAISLRYRLWTIVVNLLPRTIIALLLSTVGSQFLIGADDYEDLILNSVALGFLIEVDNMLFHAVTSDQVKEWMGLCAPLQVFRRSSRSQYCLHRTCPSRVLNTFLIVIISVSYVGYSYFRAEGKYQFGEALKCLCHTEEDYCIGAQFLGGQPSVEAAVKAMR